MGSAAETCVVVGAGSAGCVVAARLCDAGLRVVLLDAGPPLVPGEVPQAIDGSSFLDALEVPGRTFEALRASRVGGGPSSRYQRGRGVGGSSAVNAMVALHGDPALYRSWGWSEAEVDAAWASVEIPESAPEPGELGPVDRALLAAAPTAERARLTRRDGRRVSSAEAMLWPRQDRPNLVVRSDALVDRVLVEGRRAIGVQLADGAVIDADRVVVCAGAVHSPAVLLRSAVDTPGVGLGLQDHPSAALTLALRPSARSDSTALAIGSLLRQGDLQFLPMNHVGAAAAGFGLLMVALMRPRSRAGSVRLASDDPLIDPVVDFALLDDPHDLGRLVAGVRMAVDLLATPPFEEIVESVLIDGVGTPVSSLVDDAAIERWLRTSTGDYVHATSTCSMGAVVDDVGALRGYEGLFVCDASVFPSIPDVNTHLPTTMLAELLTARWLR
ncbi:MAG: GMC family oxidoreductase [Ilumatobacteraceae bacterium]